MVRFAAVIGQELLYSLALACAAQSVQPEPSAFLTLMPTSSTTTHSGSPVSASRASLGAYFTDSSVKAPTPTSVLQALAQ